ncbi:MAG: ABC transporter substrate-binding protein [Pseudomonadota bacterium]
MMRILFFIAAVWCITGQALAQTGEKIIGLSLPLEGRFGPVAQKVEFGARLALEQMRGAGENTTLKLVPSACNANAAIEQASTEAAALLEAKADIVIGSLCFRHAVALAKALNTADGTTPTIPLIALDTRNSGLDRLRRVQNVPLYSLSAAADAEAMAVVQQILPRFKGVPWALVDDGSVYGRSLTDAVRLAAEQVGMKPTVVDNFRPLQTTQIGLMRRLRQSGVEAVFIAAGPEDVVTLLSNARTLSLNWQFAAGEQAILLPFTAGASTVPQGFLMAAPQMPALQTTPELLEKLKGEEDRVEPELLLGFLAVQVAAKALEGRNPTKGLPDFTGQSFNTLVGPLQFNDEGRATPIPFGIFRWNNGSFSPVPPQQN